MSRGRGKLGLVAAALAVATVPALAMPGLGVARTGDTVTADGAGARAATPSPGNFTGKTSQGRSFKFTVSGGNVRELKFGYKVKCASREAYIPKIKVRRGRFTTPTTASITINGKFATPSRAKGTVRFEHPACRRSPVKFSFTAKRPRG